MTEHSQSYSAGIVFILGRRVSPFSSRTVEGDENLEQLAAMFAVMRRTSF